LLSLSKKCFWEVGVTLRSIGNCFAWE